MEQARLDKGLTIKELSRIAGVSPATLANIEKGWVEQRFFTVLAVGTALGITIEEMILEAGDR